MLNMVSYKNGCNLSRHTFDLNLILQHFHQEVSISEFIELDLPRKLNLANGTIAFLFLHVCLFTYLDIVF
jgi:hypothetical protein